MPYLGQSPKESFDAAISQTITGTGATSYSLTRAVNNPEELEVFINNVQQQPTTSYTVSGSTITFDEALLSSDSCYVVFRSVTQTTRSVSTATINDDAVTSAKIASSAVTSTKLASTLDLSGTGRTGHGGLKSVQVFSSAGTHTYTKPAGIRTVKVTVTGAGGQGGGYGASGDRGAGGGAGGTAIEIIDVSSVSTVTVNVGAGGSGAGATANGNGGGGSSFGSYCTGNGGGGGKHGNIGPAVGGTGGSATGGDINIIGGEGNNGIDNGYVGGGTNYTSAYGIGGASFWGGGGRGGSFNSGAQTGRAYGSGGGGGSNSNSGAGANGQIGLVVVEEFA